MNTRNIVTIATMLASSCVATHAFAQDKDCVQLKTEGKKQETYTDAQGKQATRLVSLGKVLPGDEVVWIITASNSCAKPAEKVVVNNGVPEHMAYVENSAQGATDLTFSLNGRDFAKRSDLKVTDSNGVARPANADEIKALRWVLGAPIASGANVSVSYRARVL